MTRVKTRLFYILFISFMLTTAGAQAQNSSFQSYPPANNQGYYDSNSNYQQSNQNYNQNYYQDYNSPNTQTYNQDYSYENRQQLPPLQGRVMVAPAGTSLVVATTTGISSEMNRPGDPVMARLANDLYAGGGLVLPAGSLIEGQITQIESAGRTGKNGIIGVRFTSAQTPNGQRIPISARIATEDGTGLIRGGTKKGRVGKSLLRGAVGAGLGAALGTALAPAAGGRVGKGAVYGTAIGGGAGLLSNIVREGNEAMLPSGSELQIVLDQPLTVQGSHQQQGGYNNQPQNQNYGGYNDNYGNNYNYGRSY
jgi:hypothetical protein